MPTETWLSSGHVGHLGSAFCMVERLNISKRLRLLPEIADKMARSNSIGALKMAAEIIAKCME